MIKQAGEVTTYKRWAVEHSGYINYFSSLLDQPRGFSCNKDANEALKALGCSELTIAENKDSVKNKWSIWAKQEIRKEWWSSDHWGAVRYSGGGSAAVIKSGPTNPGPW